MPLSAPSETPGLQYQHIIVLLTEGLNTSDRWYGDYNRQSPQVDARMKLLCGNIKGAGVTIYTVQNDTDNAGKPAVLPYCASAASDFFMLTQAGEIDTAFQQIGSLIKLYAQDIQVGCRRRVLCRAIRLRVKLMVSK